ncbi:hypothetical protein LNP74_18225 [Klebsiella pneumoniae subsp. pneumoniae]|nr:hypothetical protein [Klebsiella pneumoniae subsp. pneumoniae]
MKMVEKGKSRSSSAGRLHGRRVPADGRFPRPLARHEPLPYAAVKQLEGKYLVQNRVTGEIYESAQFLYILVAACLFLELSARNASGLYQAFLRRGVHL